MATIRSLRYGRRRCVASLLSLSSLTITRRWRAFLRRRRHVGTTDRNLAALGESYKTRLYNPFIRFQTAFNNCLDFILLLHSEWTHCHCSVVLYDIDYGP